MHPADPPTASRIHLEVAAQSREPFAAALRLAPARLSLAFHATPLEAMAAALRSGPGPVLVWLDAALIFRQEAGALRLLLQAPRPAQALVLHDPGQAPPAEVAALLQGSRAYLVPAPAHGEEVLERIEALTGSLHPWEEMADLLKDLVRGVADALNNPLATVSGHLQLLELQLAPPPGTAPADSLDRIRAGLARLARVVQDLEVAAGGRQRPFTRVDLSRLLREIRDEEPKRSPGDWSGVPEGLHLQTDAGLLAAALRALLALARGVAAEGVTLRAEARPGKAGLEVAIHVPALAAARWRAERTFHPFFLSRALQQPDLGLAPAVAAGAARALGGRAEARWDDDGSLRLLLHLPVAAGEAQGRPADPR